MARWRNKDRTVGNEILQHLAQCKALVDKNWDKEHEEHIRVYNRREAEDEDPNPAAPELRKWGWGSFQYGVSKFPLFIFIYFNSSILA